MNETFGPVMHLDPILQIDALVMHQFSLGDGAKKEHFVF